MPVPMACSLEPGEARARLDVWQRLRPVLEEVVRVWPGRLELRLLPHADVASIVALAQREKACCPFFAFSVEISADRLVLVVEVAEDAVELLDHLVHTGL